MLALSFVHNMSPYGHILKLISCSCILSTFRSCLCPGFRCYSSSFVY